MLYNEVNAMKTQILTVAAAFALLTSAAQAQDSAQLQKLYESGRYQQVVDASPADAPPSVQFVAAQSHLKLGASPKALEIYRHLVELPETDPWHFVGVAGEQLLVGDETTNEREWRDRLDAAIESAQRAVEMQGDLFEAHYQLGLIHARRENWPDAAAAFDRAAQLNPAHGYAHYYAGLAAYRAQRPDRMATHFEAFLKLAPEAPERPEVMQIMKTVRGN